MYTNGRELLELTMAQNQAIHEVALKKEVSNSGLSEVEIMEKMKVIADVMKNSIEYGMDHELETLGGMISGGAKKVNHYIQNGQTVSGDRINKAMARALSCSEYNASMGRICAAPTAGSSGILPAALFTTAETMEDMEEKLLNGLFTAGAIGEIISINATVSGAEGGCQAECGSASAMAAAAIVEMVGGSPEMALNAAAIALKNVMGLVCDPIAGLVEAPCAKRNSSGVVNAMTSADLSLAGVQSVIPFDEVVEAMSKVGKYMHVDLRETSQGGLAATETAREITTRIFGK